MKRENACRVRRHSFVNAPVAAIAIACLVPSALAATCEELASLSLPDTTITTAESLPAGTAPAHCRVAGAIKPTSDSNILFEVWLPAAGWN